MRAAILLSCWQGHTRAHYHCYPPVLLTRSRACSLSLLSSCLADKVTHVLTITAILLSCWQSHTRAHYQCYPPVLLTRSRACSLLAELTVLLFSQTRVCPSFHAGHGVGVFCQIQLCWFVHCGCRLHCGCRSDRHGGAFFTDLYSIKCTYRVKLVGVRLNPNPSPSFENFAGSPVFCWCLYACGSNLWTL